jgi:hypothetical protein
MSLTLDIQNYALAGNDVYATVSGASVPGTTYIVLQVYIFVDGAYTWVATERRLADNNCEAVFNLKDYLQTQIPEFFIRSDIYAQFDTVISYKVAYKESNESIYIEEELKALRGGVDDYFLEELNKLELTFYDYFYVQGKRFMTMQPNNKYVSTNTLDLLFFVATADIATVNYILTLTFSDATTQTVTLDTLVFVTDNIYKFNSGFLNLALDQYESSNKLVTSYTLKLTDGTNDISEIRTYYVDRTYYPNERQFVFENSMGVYDIMRFVGQATVTDEIDATEAIVDRTSRVLEKLNVETYVNNTGWINLLYQSAEQAKEYMREVYLSKNVSAIIELSVFPIIVTNKKILKKRDQQYVTSISLEYYIASKATFFSNIRFIKEEDLNALRDDAGVYVLTDIGEKIGVTL